ncbi:MAG: rhodanese-like domain-containing protein [Bacteroidota bacterium]
MKKFFLTIALFFSFAIANAQFKNDNVLYKNIDPFQLCSALQTSPGYILLDVRSPGEYSDTSSSGYNYGHFKNAININIRELDKRIHELDVYKDKPIFVYCSHSQRSRRVSKMLSDSGFTNINNVNGGITAFHYLSAIEKNDCLKKLYETNNTYNFISPAALCKKLTTEPTNIFLLDVRNDSLFKHISLDEKENAMGTITGSINIPLKDISSNISKIPLDKEIVLIDIYGHDAATAAVMLAGKGYKKLHVLMEGIDRWLAMDERNTPCMNTAYTASVSYNLLPVTTFSNWIKGGKEITIVDIRTDDELLNKHKDKYRNVGHIKKSLHIPATDIEKRWEELSKYKNSEIVLYGFGGGTETFSAAKTLSSKGFTKINVLIDGIFAMRWTAGNIDGYSWMKDLVEDTPEENR